MEGGGEDRGFWSVDIVGNMVDCATHTALQYVDMAYFFVRRSNFANDITSPSGIRLPWRFW